MSQNLQKFVKFQKFQLKNLVDFKKCCKTHICLQKSVPIQPKTSNILPKCCQPTLSDDVARGSSATSRRGGPRAPGTTRWSSDGMERPRPAAPAEREPLQPGPQEEATRPVARLFTHFPKMHFSKNAFSKMHFSKILQIFGGLVLGCIKTKFCKKICV